MAVKQSKFLIALFFILILGFFLRVYQLDKIPSGFFADEASIGYNAYTILTQGKDEYGTSYPIFFQAFGEYKNPIQIYTTVPLIALFGLNEFSVRLTSAILGTLGIFGLYLLVKELFKKTENSRLLALFSAIFLAISPWHLHFSRTSLEGQTAFVAFTIFALYFFFNGQKNLFLLPLSLALFSLALYSYFPARIFIPLFGFGIFLIFFPFFLKNRKMTLISFLLLIFLLPFLQALFSPSGWARWQQVNIFSHPPQNQTIAQHIINNYLTHFSLDYLFFRGDIGMSTNFITRHSVSGMGELYLFQLPLILLGVIYAFKKTEKKIFITLAIWTILYPIGSMFTGDQIQATRSIIGVVPFQIFSGASLGYLLVIKKRVLKFILVMFLAIIIVGSFSKYLQRYFRDYPMYSSGFWGWQYGPREIMRYFLENKKNYDEMFIMGYFNSPEIFIKFYDPKNSCLSKCQTGDLKNLNPARRQLFAIETERLPEVKNFSLEIKKTILYPNGQPAFYLSEIKNKQ